MRMELGRNRDELNQAVATVRDEVALFGQRVGSIESGVTKQMDTTNKRLSIITSNHDKQTEAVSQIREELAHNFTGPLLSVGHGLEPLTT